MQARSNRADNEEAKLETPGPGVYHHAGNEDTGQDISRSAQPGRGEIAEFQRAALGPFGRLVIGGGERRLLAFLPRPTGRR
eukprot:3136280-Pyramimonas_sp.AAC.1